MIRRKGPILAAAVAAAFALGWYRGLFGIDQVSPTQTEAPSPADTTQATKSAETASQSADGLPNAGGAGSTTPDARSAPSDAVAPAAGSPAVPAEPGTPTAPGFDVVRVEPDGSTVVAGKGAANEAIALTDGTRTLGEARTDANGDFVMTLSLPTGTHRLQLAQRDDAMSDDAAVVNVPPQGKPDQLLVMMQRPGEASEILQRPNSAETPPAEPEVAAPVAEAPEGVRPDPESQVAAVQPSPAPAAPSQAQSAASADVSVEAVEIEGDRLYVAGSAKSGSAIRIYLDDQLLAETRSGAGDRFIASVNADVAVGDHTIRADALDAAGRVVGRVEVPFQRPEGRSMAAIAAAPGAPTQDVAPTAAPGAGSQTNAPGGGEAAAPQAPGSDVQPDALPADADRAMPPAVGESERAEGAPASPTVSAPPRTDGELQAVRQSPLQASPSRVIIRRGDTLWRISRDTYGRGSRYTVIYLANGDQIRDPDRIYPGQVFRVPDGGEGDTPPRG